MLRINQLNLPINHTQEDLTKKIKKLLRVEDKQIKTIKIHKRSIDARNKADLKYSYVIDVALHGFDEKKEESFLKRVKNQNINVVKEQPYSFQTKGEQRLKHRPIIVGCGPAGIFCAYLLAKNGYQPLLIERGDEIEKRVKHVENFWNTNELDTESNVQFGEGGAGTFSDGKLNTMVKDVTKRYDFIMKTFVEHGAPDDILYLNKPHIGTDKLRDVVTNMRKEIIAYGGEVRFRTKLTDIHMEQDKICEIEVNHKERIPCEVLVLAIGHSARDTFELLAKKNFDLSPKAFAIGVRVQHKQDLISESQYGNRYKELGPADYKLTYQTSNGRGVYSFCMCPGGIVVNSSSEKGHLVVNGMSNYLRDEENANSAIIVTVKPEDYWQVNAMDHKLSMDEVMKDPLAGVHFQRKWEKLAYETGKGKIPIQLLGDLLQNKKSVTIGKINPVMKGGYTLSDLNECLPEFVLSSIKEGMVYFDKKIKGFGDEETLLAGVETRTSSPIRIERNDELEAPKQGIYPCGEGAGYAGGITSAAIDGMKVFEAIASKYARMK